MRLLFHKAHSISAYGKLPFSREFLRWECSSRLALGLKEWLDRGAAEALAAIGPGPVIDGPKQLLFVAGSEALAASVWESDDGGEQRRRFPFTLFFPVSVRDLVVHGTALGTALHAAWDELLQLRDRVAASTSVSAFYEAMAATQLPKLPDQDAASRQFRVWAKTIDFRAWARAVGDGEDEGTIKALFRLRTLLARVRRGEVSRSALAIRLPVDRSQSTAGQCDVWSQIIARNLGSPLLPVSLVVDATSAEPCSGSATMLARPVQPADFFLLSREPSRASVADIASKEPLAAVEGYGRFRERLTQMLAGSSSSLADLTDLDFGSITSA